MTLHISWFVLSVCHTNREGYAAVNVNSVPPLVRHSTPIQFTWEKNRGSEFDTFSPGTDNHFARNSFFLRVEGSELTIFPSQACCDRKARYSTLVLLVTNKYYSCWIGVVDLPRDRHGYQLPINRQHTSYMKLSVHCAFEEGFVGLRFVFDALTADNSTGIRQKWKQSLRPYVRHNYIYASRMRNTVQGSHLPGPIPWLQTNTSRSIVWVTQMTFVTSPGTIEVELLIGIQGPGTSIDTELHRVLKAWANSYRAFVRSRRLDGVWSGVKSIGAKVENKARSTAWLCVCAWHLPCHVTDFTIFGTQCLFP
jgi:hypothetical protein